MSRLTKAQPRHDTTPAFLAIAKAFYGPAFEPRRKAELAEAMADWADLTPDEQSFAMAHLQYLNLVAASGTHALLADIRDLLEELAESVDDALDAEEDEPEPAEAPMFEPEVEDLIDELPPEPAEIPELDGPVEAPEVEEVPDASE